MRPIFLPYRGAEGGTRTLTSFRTLASKTSAYAFRHSGLIISFFRL